ncbi:MAG: DUF4194 domain-containing protein [Actinoallomurus sp.]
MTDSRGPTVPASGDSDSGGTDPDGPNFENVFGELLTAAEQPVSEQAVAELLAAGDDDPVAGVIDSGDRQPRFDGDTSELPDEACWALQDLLVSPFVTSKDGRRWAAIRQYEVQLRSRLSELNTLLVLNLEHGHALTVPAGDPSPRAKVLQRTRPLSLAASALLLYLYERYITAVEDPVVDQMDMVDHMTVMYKRADDTDEVAFHNRVVKAIATLTQLSILNRIGNSSNYQVSSVVVSLLTADQVTAMTERFKGAGLHDSDEGGEGASEGEEEAEDA